jgi:hypothetical protein
MCDCPFVKRCEFPHTQKNAPRAATIVADTPHCHFLTLSRREWVALLRLDHRRVLAEKIDFFSTHDMFKDWSNQKLLAFANCLKVRHYQRGMSVFNRGDESNSVFFIKRGEVACCLTADAIAGVSAGAGAASGHGVSGSGSNSGSGSGGGSGISTGNTAAANLLDDEVDGLDAIKLARAAAMRSKKKAPKKRRTREEDEAEDAKERERDRQPSAVLARAAAIAGASASANATGTATGTGAGTDASTLSSSASVAALGSIAAALRKSIQFSSGMTTAAPAAILLDLKTSQVRTTVWS